MNKNMGKLIKVDLREFWKDEARDFTPGIANAENLKILSDEIGIEIKLIQVESGVGRYNADILAEEEGTGRKIIIENQLEPTNHDHLGKIITYAAGHDAGIVIWIFKDIRDEHRQAIDWLNEHTDDNLAFFAVKMELWRIDESIPAPKFEIIASPNEWAKAIKQSSSGSNELSDTKLQQLEFWSKFKSFVLEKDRNIRLQTPRSQHWYNVSMGTSECHISLTVNTRESMIGCEIYISRNKDLFSYLSKQKEIIEKELGYSLEWIDAPVASRIKISHAPFNIINEASYKDYFAWFYDQIIIFKKVFGMHIKEFKNN